jgi:hypothetical protein
MDDENRHRGVAQYPARHAAVEQALKTEAAHNDICLHRA